MRVLLLKFVGCSFVLLIAAFASGAQVPDVEAQIINLPVVIYPAEAKATGLSGVVSVAVEVDETGKVTVGETAGPDQVCPSYSRADVMAMRTAAAKAAENATFTPAMKDGRPIASKTVLRFDFEDPQGKPKSVVEPARVIGDSDTGEVIKLSTATAAQPSMTLRPTDTIVGNGGLATTPTRSIDTPTKLISADTISDGVLNGKALTLPKPAYPPAARAVHAGGAVVVKVLIDGDGRVFTAEAVTGHPLLRAASRTAACSAEFQQTLFSGKPIKVLGVLVYNFVP
jgi:hypothetical protein